MAVYTALDPDALVEWLSRHDVGELIDCQGIPSGIENSNYFVDTRRGDARQRFVLTLFERLDAEQLPYYLALMNHLAARAVPCPAPIADRDGALSSSLSGKPAALVTRLDGRAVGQPTVAHCVETGAVLAGLHEAGRSFERHLPNPRGHDWWIATAGAVRAFLDDAQRALLDAEIALVADRWVETTRTLPRGPIHADLFRDNALFADTGTAVRLSGIIDFYFAGTDAWLLDLAICLNDWCVDASSGALDAPRVAAFVDAYDTVRPLTDEELAALPQVLRAAALRFWLSRLDDLHRPRAAQLLTPHDPTQFERLLRRRRAEAIAGATFPLRRPADRPGAVH